MTNDICYNRPPSARRANRPRSGADLSETSNDILSNIRTRTIYLSNRTAASCKSVIIYEEYKYFSVIFNQKTFFFLSLLFLAKVSLFKF